MIHRQDLFVLLLYYLGYSRIRNLLLRLQRKPVARFVAFHDIQPESVKYFEASLNFLKHNTNVISLDDFMSGRLSLEKINVVITFDDGFKSWITDAVPILRQLGLPATFFVSSGFVGLPKEDETEFIRSRLLIKQPTNNVTGGLNSEDVKKIVGEGFIVGGHTLNHYILTNSRNSDHARYEIAEDKMRLERLTGTEIKYFAYPSGAYQNPDIKIIELLKEFGYRGAVTTVSGFNNAMTNRYLLHRELTRSSMSGPVFRARVYGNYDAVGFLKQLGRMILWQ